MAETIPKYGFIDALRGYAILGVVLVHASGSVTPTSPALQSLMSAGARGVQLFYIVSALTLCMSWESRSSQEASPIRNYLLRRFFRIAPMFYFAILFYVGLYGLLPRYWAPNGVEWWYIPRTALFLHGVHPETITSVVPGGWSIAVEMTFYLALPLLLLHKSAKSLLLFFLFSVVLYVISKAFFENLFHESYPPSQQYLVSSFSYLSFFGQLPVFAIGLIAYAIFRSKVYLRPFVFFGNVFFLSCLLLSFLMLGDNILRVLLHYIVLSLAFALFALTLACYPTRLFVNKPIIQLGKISFSMYLTHFAVLHFYSTSGVAELFRSGDVASVLYFLCVVTTTAGLSYGFFVAVEQPGILLGKRIVERLECGARARAKGP